MRKSFIQVDSLDHAPLYGIVRTCSNYVWEFSNDLEQAQKDLAWFNNDSEKNGTREMFEIVEIKATTEVTK